MPATPLEFRLRYLVQVLLVILGFSAPWNLALHLDHGSTWLLLAVYADRSGVLTLGQATITFLALGILFATIAAALRTWSSAYLGYSIVYDSRMRGDQLVAEGPYRRVRNPLYLGTFTHTLALALLMPATGAIFTVLAIGLFQLRLIVVEEAFLRAALGSPYQAYCILVPSLIPALGPRLPASDKAANWPASLLGELYFWGVAGSFAVVGWRYNASLLTQCIIVSLGISLVARALIPKK